MRAAVALLLMLASACTAPRLVAPRELFPLLEARDLPRFERELTLTERAEPESDRGRLARGWADLVSCREVDSGEPTAGELSIVLAGLALERARLERARGDGQDLSPTWLGAVTDPAFFRREPDAQDVGEITWGPDTEVWLDERPALQPVPSGCAPTAPAGFASDAAPPDRPAILADEQAAASLVLRRARGQELSGELAALVWRARAQIARVRLRRAEGAEPDEAARLRAGAAGYLVRLLADPAPSTVTPIEDVEARLMAASLTDDPDRAAALLRPVADLSLPREHALRVRLRLLAAESSRGDDEAAAELALPLPPRRHPLFGWGAFEAARVFARRGDRAGVLGVATEALHDAPIDADPHLGAILRLALLELSRFDFDERLIELAEELGPRHALHGRLELLVGVALLENRPRLADDVARWLEERETDHRRRRLLLAQRAFAAFLHDDDAAFARLVDRLVERPPALLRAVGRTRREAFFASQDRALAALLGALLPRLGPGAEELPTRRRRAWLARLVERVQAFLRSTPGSLAREPLLSFYRSASAMLRDLPRGYAVRLDREGADPLVLGRVELPFPEPPPPAVPLLLTAPPTFALLPPGDHLDGEWRAPTFAAAWSEGQP